jgi:catechol 2,3-dioxygenase-like lactoylglutathione lyase family enzyme
MHLVVPDRAAAARWYERVLGFEPVAAFQQWADVEGGPLHLSADGGHSGVALFEAGPHPAGSIGMGVAFRVDADAFLTFARALPSDDICSPDGGRLEPASVVDFDLCFSFTFADPWEHALELNCYDTDRVRREWIEIDGIRPVRYW